MKIIQKTLSTGLRIVLAPQADAATATAMILVGTGSNYENDREQGLSHFLEHMYFKGTEAYPTAQILAESFDNLGAISNAFTSHEYTGYYAKGNPAHAETFIDILSDIYLHSTFPEKEIEKEKGVIIEEINMYEDMPQRKVWNILNTLLYGDQPAGRPIGGTKESVSSFSRKDFIQYQKQHYTAANTIVVVGGAFDPAHIERAIKKAFATIQTIKPKTKKKTSDVQSVPQRTVFHKKTDQAHIALAFRSLPIGHPDAPVLSLISTLLGDGMSSRLFMRLREELGAAYYANADQDASSDHGVFTIAAGIDKNRLPEIISNINEILRDLKNNLISDKELHKIKEYSIGMLRLGLESSDSIAIFYGTQVLMKGEYKTPEQYTKEYMKVTAPDIRRVARKIFVSKHANLAVVGPFEEKNISPLILDNI